MSRRAFTLVELLVVISIIGLLSTIAVASTSNARNKAKTAKIQADLKQMSTYIELARQMTGSTLWTITGSNCSACSCSGDLRNIAEASACAQLMLAQWNKIFVAAGGPVRTTVLRDPWGSPYQIDENEGESTNLDDIFSVGPDGTMRTADDTDVYIPRFGN